MITDETEDRIDGLTKISHSEIESFLLCQRRHYYSYGLKLRSKRPSKALIRGIIGHSALDAYYKMIKAGNCTAEDVKTAIVKSCTETSEEYEDSDDVAMEVIKLLRQYVEANFEKEKEFDIIATEEAFKLNIDDEFYISMVIDLIYRGWEGVTIRDHKFVYDFYSPTQVSILPQLPIYTYALKREGYQIDKAEYNQIRYRVTKGNEDNPDAKFQIESVELNMNRLKTTMREYLMAARRIKELKEMPLEEWEQSITRAYSSVVCDRCPFRELCALDLNGGDTESFIDMRYDRR